jgi:hypothetical protein
MVIVIYPDLDRNIGQSSYLVPRAILTPTNKIVDDLNHHILNQLQGEENNHLSLDSICKANFNVQDQSEFETFSFNRYEILTI